MSKTYFYVGTALLMLTGILTALLAVQTVHLKRVESEYGQLRAALAKETQTRKDSASYTDPFDATEEESLSVFDDVDPVEAEQTHGAAASEGSATRHLDLATLNRLARADDSTGARAKGPQRDGRKKDRVGAKARAQDDKAKSKDGDARARVNAVLGAVRDKLANGDYQGALNDLANALRVDPRDARLYRELAQLYGSLGMYSEQIQTYQAWSSVLPNDSSPHMALARLYASQGQMDAAYTEAAAYVSASANEPDTYRQAANLYRQLGDTQSEGVLLQTWAAQTPNSVDAHTTLASYYQRHKDYAQAVQEYTLAAQLTPSNADIHAQLAALYRRTGDTVQAQNEMLTAVNLKPNDAALQMQLASLYRASGDSASALQTYQQVVQRYPGTPQARIAQRAINRLTQTNAKPKANV